MVEVKIRLKRGAWEIEVTCPEERVKEVVESLLSGFESAKPEVKVAKGATTCRSLIEGLWREGWFSEHRALGEVYEELGRRGYHYDKTAIAHTLTDLVREGILYREGSPRSYRYIQKRPPA